MITISEQPSPALKMFDVKMGKVSMEIGAKASDEMAEAQNGWTCLSVNPVKSEVFASGSQYFEMREVKDTKLGSVQLWNTDSDLAEDVVPEG